MDIRQGLLLELMRKYEDASADERIAMTAAVVRKCRESGAPVPNRLKSIYSNSEQIIVAKVAETVS